jgi:hypothetical protein
MTPAVRNALAGSLVMLGVVWLFVNKSVGEGPVLLVLGGGHGVTASDLFSLAAFLAAGWLAVAPRLRRTVDKRGAHSRN